MENFNNVTSIGASRRWEKTRRKWAPYEACPTCHAVAGNPCRNLQLSSWPGGATTRNEPHPDRPKKTTDAG